ncbi:unnamed protein product [Penicillium pancosmium]
MVRLHRLRGPGEVVSFGGGANDERCEQSAQNSAGIQTLLDAEREAQKIVQQDRTKRIRDAKSEAQKEIEEYRNQKENEYKKFEAEHSSGFKTAEADANKEAEEKLKGIEASGKKQGDKVVADLIKATTDVKPQVPEKIAKA